MSAAVPVMASLVAQDMANKSANKQIVTYQKYKLPSGAVVTLPNFTGKITGADSTLSGIASGLSTWANTGAAGDGTVSTDDLSTKLVDKYTKEGGGFFGQGTTMEDTFKPTTTKNLGSSWT